MAKEISGFFDSVGEDRRYQADEFALGRRVFLTDGIKNGGDNLRVTAPGTGMLVQVDYGVGMIRGYHYLLMDDDSGKLMLQLDEADAQKRFDRVVLRLDTGLDKREIYVDVVKGTPGVTPNPPALARDGNVWELSLALIEIGPTTTIITETEVADERYDAEVCGLINSLIALDASEFQAQAQAIIDGLSGMGYLPANGGTLGAYTEKRVVLSGTSPEIDLDEGNVFVQTLSGATEYEITGAVSGKAHSFTLILTQPSTPVAVTWPGSVLWPGGDAPDMDESGVYALTFVSVDGGTVWLGMGGGGAHVSG